MVLAAKLRTSEYFHFDLTGGSRCDALIETTAWGRLAVYFGDFLDLTDLQIQ